MSVLGGVDVTVHSKVELSLRIKHFESEIAGDYVHTVGRIAGDIRCISLYVMETVNFFLIHISWYMGHF